MTSPRSRPAPLSGSRRGFCHNNDADASALGEAWSRPQDHVRSANLTNTGAKSLPTGFWRFALALLATLLVALSLRPTSFASSRAPPNDPGAGTCRAHPASWHQRGCRACPRMPLGSPECVPTFRGLEERGVRRCRQRARYDALHTVGSGMIESVSITFDPPRSVSIRPKAIIRIF
jgi:hypothetical protein